MNTSAATSIHILLVEQDESISGLFFTLLRSYGYLVSVARGAQQALDQVAIAAPHVVFTSLVFDDIDGFELCRRLRSLPQTSKSLIVALTGYCEAGIHEQAEHAGFDTYLLKPVSVHTLQSLIESYATTRRALQSHGKTATSRSLSA